MATYVISDIHGMYNKFTELLNKIKLKDTDTLYILGDVLDRGTRSDQNIAQDNEHVKCDLHAWQS